MCDLTTSLVILDMASRSTTKTRVWTCLRGRSTTIVLKDEISPCDQVAESFPRISLNRTYDRVRSTPARRLSSTSVLFIIASCSSDGTKANMGGREGEVIDYFFLKKKTCGKRSWAGKFKAAYTFGRENFGRDALGRETRDSLTWFRCA